MTYKKFENFETFTAADANLLLRQGIIVVDDADERNTIDSPTEGMQVYRIDTKRVERYTGTDWDSGDSGWISVSSFSNSWTSSTTRYRRIGKVVYLDGAITGGSNGTAFTLPAGFRPDSTQSYIVQGSSSQTAASVALITVGSSGAVIAVSGQTPRLNAVVFPVN